MTTDIACEKHPDEKLVPCNECGEPVCGICECYISPFSKVPLSKEVFEAYLSPEYKISPKDWNRTPRVAHLNCLKVPGTTFPIEKFG
jgi:hypothetical protein